MTSRCTIKCPNLPVGVEGISPDDLKTLSKAEIDARVKKIDQFNKHAKELGDIIISEIQGVDITWCKDGTFVMSCTDSMLNVENLIKNHGLEIVADKTEIKHKVRTLPDGTSEEDIDEVFVQDETKPKTKLKSMPKINQFKAKSLP